MIRGGITHCVIFRGHRFIWRLLYELYIARIEDYAVVRVLYKHVALAEVDVQPTIGKNSADGARHPCLAPLIQSELILGPSTVLLAV